MDRDTISVCSRFHAAVELIGARWTGAILQVVLSGRYRYADIKSAIPGVSDTMLTQRLRELESQGLLERHVLPTSPVRVEYCPTEKGRDLGPVLEAIGVWAHRWIVPDAKQGAAESGQARIHRGGAEYAEGRGVHE